MLQVALAAQTTVATSANDGTPAQLRERRADLLKQIEIAKAKGEQDDPLWAESMKRQDALRTSPPTASAQDAATKWFKEHSNSANVNLVRRNPLYLLHAAIQMLKDPTDTTLLREAVVGRSTLSKQELADDLVKQFASLDRESLDDPAQLWEAVKTKLPEAEKSLDAKIANLPKRSDCPPSVVQTCIDVNERYLRMITYSAYRINHIPLPLRELYAELDVIENRLSASTKPATKPASD